MACDISYIQSQPLSETEKSRLSGIHIDIFKRAKDSKAFKEVKNRLQAVKSKYADATSFIGSVNSQFGEPVSRLNSIGGGNAVLSVNVLPLANEQQEVLFSKSAVNQLEANPETIKKVKDLLGKMGIEIQDLQEYAKATGIETSSVNGLADYSRNLVAIAEGLEGVALTEEMVHLATYFIEAKNPKLITEMISKIDRFKIYKETFEAYKDLKWYQLSNGKPDIRKIKKEAVDKLIAEIFISNNENIDQYPELAQEENISLINKWWNSILDWIKGEYRSSGISLFEDVAKSISEGKVIDEEMEAIENAEIYFNIVTDTQRQIQNKLQNTQNKVEKVVEVTKADPLLLDSEEANNYYRYKEEDGSWTKVTKRVTDRVKAWYKERFGNKIFSDQEKKFNELKREYGIKGHLDFEEIHARYFNKDGTKRVKPLERINKPNLPSQDMYDKLEKYYVDMINTFPEGTLILSETILYDEKQKEAGTIDFLAIDPTGKATILDWKFMSATGEDVPWYKQGAYNVQIGRYKEMLKSQYGVKSFGMLRAIPVIMDFKPLDPKNKKSELVLKGIAIGTVDTNKIQDLKLLPVAEESESTGLDALDAIISKLNAYSKQVAKEKTSNEEDRLFKIERISTLNKAIRQAHINQNVVPLIEVIEVMRKDGEKILEDYILSYKNRPATLEDSTNSELSDFSEEMRDFIKISDVFTEIGDDLGNLIYTDAMKKEAKTDAEKKELEIRKGFLDKLNDESRLIRISQKAIKQAAKDFADKHIGERNLVTGLLKPEKIVKGLGSLFRGVSDLPLRSLEILHKLTRSAQGKASEAALKEINKIEEIRKKLVERGNVKKTVQQLYQKTEEGWLVNKLINKFQKDFFTELDEQSKAGGSLKWLKENIDVEAYKKEADEVIKSRIDRIKKTTYPGSEEEVEGIKDSEIIKVRRQFDIERIDFNGWDNYILKRHPLEKWLSEEYKTIAKDADLLELYNFIVGFNDKAKDIGYIQNTAAKTFIPFVRKTMAEELSFDNSISPIQRLQDAVELRADDVGYGSINQVTGELENGIPKYYTYDFTGGVNDFTQISEDLFKNMILYIQQVEKYKYMTEIEGQLKLIKDIESFKGHLNTNRSGNIVSKDGKVEILPGNAENTKMYDDFLRVLLYDQRYVLSDTDTPLNVGNAVNFVKKGVNKVAGKEIWKVTENPNPTSLHKTIDAANRGFQIKTLGLEFISGAVNMFGGNIQLATQAGNYFKAREVAVNEAKLTTLSFAGEEEKDIFAQLVNTFMPMKDDPAYEIFKEAGMTILTKQNLGDILMVFMRKPEQLIEKSVFLTLLENTMVVDGRIVNIREFIKSKYKDRYNSSARYQELKGKIESEIEELKKTSSIAVTRKLENGKLVIPGLDLTNRDELQRLTNLSRRIARNATGGMSDGDINRMSMSIWTKSMMIFKNWIPKLADTRFSEFRKIADDFSVRINEDGISEGQKYDIGRIRLLAYVLSDGIFTGVRNLNNILALNQAGLDRLDVMLEDFREKYEAETGEILNITRDEFIDLIRTNLRNQLKELAILGSLLGATLSLGFIAPEDDDDKAAKNAHRYALRVVDKFVSELSFFYNPAELESILSGGIFPAIGLVKDFERFTSNFFTEITGMDFNPETSFEEARKKAQPIKYAMKMAPITKSLVTYLSIISDDFAREYEVTISAESRR